MKSYSKQVYNSNREQILSEKKRNEEKKENEKGKEIEDLEYVNIKKYSEQIYKINREKILLQKKREEKLKELKENSNDLMLLAQFDIKKYSDQKLNFFYGI